LKGKRKSKWTPPTKGTFLITFFVWLVSLLTLLLKPEIPRISPTLLLGYVLALLAWLGLALGILCEKL